MGWIVRLAESKALCALYRIATLELGNAKYLTIGKLRFIMRIGFDWA